MQFDFLSQTVPALKIYLVIFHCLLTPNTNKSHYLILLFYIVKARFLLKNGIFSVEALHSLPGASFFFNLSVKTKVFSDKFNRLLKVLFLLSVFCSNLLFLNWLFSIFLSLTKSYISRKYFPSFGFKLYFSILSGAKPYFLETIWFICCAAFFMRLFGFIVFFFFYFSNRLILNKIL